MAKAPNLDRASEVCERLGIDRSTLSRWVKSGRITPAMKLDGLRGPYLFEPSEVERVAAEMAAEKTTEPEPAEAGS